MQAEKPILFSAPMVKAILEGRKTQTRRLAAVPTGDHNGTDIMDWGLSKHPYKKDGKWFYNIQTYVDDYATRDLKCCWQVGDHLWVRETIYEHGHYYTGSFDETGEYETRWISGGGVSYAATDTKPEKCRTKPSIHMHKKYARIWLEVTDIRVERLAQISEQDAIAEGVRFTDFGKDQYGQQHRGWHVFPVTSHEQCLGTARTAFGNLWEKINGMGSFGDYNNSPFVWVISFNLLSTHRVRVK